MNKAVKQAQAVARACSVATVAIAGHSVVKALVRVKAKRVLDQMLDAQ